MIVNTIIIHCSATKFNKNVSVKDIELMHRNRGFRKIGYHYYITKDGVIHSGREESETGAHCLGYNNCSIGICYEGGLNENGKPKDTRTEEQKESIIKLISEIVKRHGIKRIIGHRDVSIDLDGDGEIEPHEYIKSCPCFNARPEYRHLIPK